MDAVPTPQPGAGTARPPSLSTPLERLPGVGTARARRLAALELFTARDALMHFPRGYRDFSGAHRLADLREGEHASIAGDVVDVAARSLATGRQMLTVLLRVEGGHVRAIWFNMPFMAKRFAPGMRLVVAGQARKAGTGWEFAHPDVRWLERDEQAGGSEWLADYPLADGVHQSHVRMAVQAAIEHAADLPAEAFPEKMLETKSLLPIGRAIREMHRPSSP
ncbi:MAG: hypothetical protein EBZ59_09870, partial [Planctomycetia bacterium]|nr:hypothetical protein [Planctomycetia bacterium]